MNFLDSPITILLIAINAIVSFIGFSNADFVNKAIMWPYKVKRQQQYYRMITSGFLHADWMHLIFNMFTLYFFGRNIEIIFSVYGLGGNLSYLALYLTSLIVADIPGYMKHKDDYGYRALGASGAVSAIVFAAIVFSPWNSIYLYGAIRISALVYAVLFIFYSVYMDKKGADNINHNAHLWGAIYGFIFTLILIAAIQPSLFAGIIEELQKPSFLGRG